MSKYLLNFVLNYLLEQARKILVLPVEHISVKIIRSLIHIQNEQINAT